MSHWCLTCMKYPTSKEYETICKEKNHDIDFEDMFTPSNKELGLQTKLKKKIPKDVVEEEEDK